nr:U32 family peptidase [Eubacterium sp.]
YTYSDVATKGFLSSGYQAFTTPYELNEQELRHHENGYSEMVVYGYQPVMQSAQCLRKNTGQCTKDSKLITLTDRKKRKMMVKPHCDLCYNTIYNAEPLCLLQHSKKLLTMGFSGFRLQFLKESKKEVSNILRDYENAFVEHGTFKPEQIAFSYTNGHFKRGVE